MKKENKIILYVMSISIVVFWTLLAFLVADDLVPRFSLWANLVIGTETTVTSIIALFISIITFKKTEELRKQKIEDEANIFIKDNNGSKGDAYDLHISKSDAIIDN